jgi:predicted RNA-binding Zn-ribbon protein involved in translation (DUF1610 family)
MVEGYCKMIEKFIKINISLDTGSHDTIICTACKAEISEDTEDYCPNCGLVINRYLVSSAFVDTVYVGDTTGKQTKNPYDKFHELYLRFQGRSGTVIGENVIKKTKEFIDGKYPNLNCTMARKQQNMQFLIEGLISTGNSNFIPDRNVIMKIIWNYPISTYKHLDEKIEKQWHDHQVIIENHKEEKDRQTINYNDWRLWREINCALADNKEPELHFSEFQISSNKDVQKKAELLWKKCCEMTGKPYVDELNVGI